MSTLAAAAEDFAAGAAVLVGDDRSETVLVAALTMRVAADPGTLPATSRRPAMSCQP